MLTAISLNGRINNRTYWNCICSCGGNKVADYWNLVSGRTKSCGCLRGSGLYMKKYPHLYTKERVAWKSMRARCLTKTHRQYKQYGGRGIKIASRWFTYAAFLKDMGKSPPNSYLDRIDNNKGYSKSNCRWATSEQSARNRRSNTELTFNSITLTAKEWAEKLGIKYSTIIQRLSRNLPVKKVLSLCRL